MKDAAALSIDDAPTLAAFGILAFALADVSHEALGHGMATLAVGGRAVLLTTCYFNASGHYSVWIPAAGGLMNLAVGLVSLAGCRVVAPTSSRLHYLLVLSAAFNLFFAFGYPAYSGIALFGDWAAVIAGLKPLWLWRVLLVLISVGGYYGSMRLLAGPLASFAGTAARLRRIALIPYVAAIILACLAGALNPQGWRTMLTAGIPAAAASFGLRQMDHFVGSVRGTGLQEAVGPVQRSLECILAAVAVLIFFVGILGPGIRFS